MLPAHADRIIGMLRPEELVLDVGGGASPFSRADWVIDILAYEERRLYGAPKLREKERFSASTWLQHDICSSRPWPFETDQFDFAVCSHTLEDVRDPIRVCEEMIRVAKAGYIEVPSRLEEQSFGFQGPWTGWGHHRWLIDLDDDGITFVFKHHVVHRGVPDHFPEGFRQALTPEQRVQSLWWTSGFRYQERIFHDGPSVDGYLRDFVRTHLAYYRPARPSRSPRRALARLRRGPGRRMKRLVSLERSPDPS